MNPNNEYILYAARAAKEVSIVVTLVLMASQGDGDAALVLLDDVAHIKPQAIEELDAVAIGAQAIREAQAMARAASEF